MYSSVQLSDLIQWTGGKLHGDVSLDLKISVPNSDTRTLKTGDIFIALRGEKYDANQFLDQAAEKGAVLLIAEKPCTKVATLVVIDSLKALVQIGAALRHQFKGKVVGITGSAGKSSTKEMTATLLGKDVVRSPASFNNLLGVSKTLCLVEDSTKNLVLEMGMNALGEIAELCDTFLPEAGLITNIGDAHIGKLGSREGIYRAKKEMYDFLAKQGNKTRGVGVNQDDPLVVKAFQEAFKGRTNTVTYSATGKNADVIVMKQSINPKNGFLDLDLKVRGETFRAAIPIFGKHQAENIAAAISLALVLEVSIADIKDRLKNIQPAYHRGEVRVFSDGRVLIDESYNSNPTALHSALSTLSEFEDSRHRILVLGEMREMGDFSEKVHREAGRAIVQFYESKKTPLTVIGIGSAMRFALEEVNHALPSVPSFFYPTVKEAIDPVRALFKSAHDVLFVKGSRGIELDLLVNAVSS